MSGKRAIPTQTRRFGVVQYIFFFADNRILLFPAHAHNSRVDVVRIIRNVWPLDLEDSKSFSAVYFSKITTNYKEYANGMFEFSFCVIKCVLKTFKTRLYFSKTKQIYSTVKISKKLTVRV